MCDLQQSSLTLDVTRPGMIEIVNYLKSTVGTESFIHSSRFNRIQEVTLVCHNVIQQTYLNYLLPELVRFKNVSLFMEEEMKRADKYHVPTSILHQFQTVWSTIMDILNDSTNLIRVEVIGCPLSQLILIESLWTRIEELTIRRNE